MPDSTDQQPAGAQPAAPKEVAATVESWDDFSAAVGDLTPAEAAKAVLEAKRWEQRAKQNGDHKRIADLERKAQQFDALEQASKSELERAQEQAQALQLELASTQRNALIASVALDKGLPANLARRLQGESRDELEADADELLAQFGTTHQSTTRTPAPDHSQGSSANGGSHANPAQQFASLIQQMPG